MPWRHNPIILCGHIILEMTPPQIFGMTPPMDLSERIGRRLKLQDLYVLTSRSARYLTKVSWKRRPKGSERGEEFNEYCRLRIAYEFGLHFDLDRNLACGTSGKSSFF